MVVTGIAAKAVQILIVVQKIIIVPMVLVFLVQMVGTENPICHHIVYHILNAQRVNAV